MWDQYASFCLPLDARPSPVSRRLADLPVYFADRGVGALRLKQLSKVANRDLLHFRVSKHVPPIDTNSILFDSNCADRTISATCVSADPRRSNTADFFTSQMNHV